MDKTRKKEYDKVYSRKYRRDNPEWKKLDNKRNAKLINKLTEEYQKKYPERSRATANLYNAIKRGEVKRQPCIICGNPKSHGHHEDYSKQLDVKWLCPKHHKAVHYGLIKDNKVD